MFQLWQHFRTRTAWNLTHRQLSGLGVLGLSLMVAGVVLVSSPQGAAVDGADDVAVNAIIDMTCFPPPPSPGEEPGIGPPPPCVLPDGLDSRFVSPHPSGRAHLVVNSDDTTRIKIELQGLAPNLVITAWLAYFFPPGPTPDPIFDPLGPGLPPVAGLSAPLAPTHAAFSEGLGRDPNRFVIRRHGSDVRGTLIAHLNYNPLKAGQGPLRNELSLVTQAAVPSDSVAAQPDCCPNGIPGPQPQPTGASFLRAYDPAIGFQLRQPNGRPTLLRSPVPAVVIAIVVHIDDTTHGIAAGIPIPPRPGTPMTVGDHYTLGLFDLRQFHVE